MIRKELSEQKGLVRVTLELPPTMLAERINVVGGFNDWDTTALPMSQKHVGSNWRVTVHLAAGRCYRFRYLIDGKEWFNDWHADDHVENPYGSYDSVVDLVDLKEFSGSPSS